MIISIIKQGLTQNELNLVKIILDSINKEYINKKIEYLEKKYSVILSKYEYENNKYNELYLKVKILEVLCKKELE